MNDKNQCVKGEIDCLQYSLTTCSTELANNQTTAAAALATCATFPPGCEAATSAASYALGLYTQCTIKREELNQLCNQYKNTWFIPCMGGMSTPMAMQTPIDVNGDGKQEIPVLSAATEQPTNHVEKME